MEEKMKKILLCLLAVLVLVFSDVAPVFAAQATDVIPMPDLMNPETITADDKQLYISADTTVYIYSLDGYRLIKSFGQRGDGPGEFKPYWDFGVLLNAKDGQLLVNSRGKLSYYSKDGAFIKEQRMPNGYYHEPFGNRYVYLRGRVKDGLRWNTVNIYDDQFNPVKEISQKKNWFQPGQAIDPIDVRNPRFCIYKDRVFVENTTGNIDIFNKKGQLLFSTQQVFGRQKVSETDKADYHTYYKTHPAYKDRYHALKQLIKFPAHFPYLKYFDVANGYIYVFTYIKKDGKSEVFLFDTNGQLKEKKYLDMPDINPQDVFPMVRVRNGKVYQLIEDEDAEEWQLHVTTIHKVK
jgi:hypothetical protein